MFVLIPTTLQTRQLPPGIQGIKPKVCLYQGVILGIIKEFVNSAVVFYSTISSPPSMTNPFFQDRENCF